jgi:hypothetical protein
MINDQDIEYVHIENKYGYPLAWVVDGECVYTLPLNKEYADVFLNCNSAEDVSHSYPEHDGLTVRLLKDSEELEVLQTSEYFGSVLLSNPLVINLYDYPYGEYVEPNEATFIDNQFTLKRDDMSILDPYINGPKKSGDSIQ